LRALDEFQVVAVATTRHDTARATAEAYGVPHAFADAAELVSHPEVDVVAITVKVTEHDRLIRAALAAGKHVFSEWPLGIDLAAPQVGVPIALAVLKDGPERWAKLTDAERTARERVTLPFTVLVNPEVLPAAGDLVGFYEGCLSLPGLTGVVARHRAVRVTALDEHGEPVVRAFSGWPARIVQHEVDHLGGILYVDRVETRSLSTPATYERLWAGRPVSNAAAAYGFPLP
jgi:peptide deformylase